MPQLDAFYKIYKKILLSEHLLVIALGAATLVPLLGELLVSQELGVHL